MNKSFFTIICGFLIFAATVSIRAQSKLSVEQCDVYESYNSEIRKRAKYLRIFNRGALSKRSVQGLDARHYLQFHVDSCDGKYGLLFRGKVVIPYKYDKIVAQQDNRRFILKQDGKYGIMDVGTTYYIPKTHATNTSHYFLVDKGVKGKKDMYLDLTFVLPCEFDDIKTIDGRYWVSKSNLYGIYTMSGSIVLRCEFDDIKTVDGRYWVSKSNLYGVYTMSGSIVLRCEFDNIKTIDGRYWVSKSNLYGIYTMSGSIVLRCEFDDIKTTTIDGRYWVSKDNLKGIYNFSGGNVLRCEFEKIELTSDGRYIAYKDGNKSLYSLSGSRLHTDFNVIYSTY